MVMTASTLESLAHEELGGVLHLLVDVGYLPIPDHSWVSLDLASGREDLAHKFAVGPVLG